MSISEKNLRIIWKTHSPPTRGHECEFNRIRVLKYNKCDLSIAGLVTWSSAKKEYLFKFLKLVTGYNLSIRYIEVKQSYLILSDEDYNFLREGISNILGVDMVLGIYSQDSPPDFGKGNVASFHKEFKHVS